MLYQLERAIKDINQLKEDVKNITNEISKIPVYNPEIIVNQLREINEKITSMENTIKAITTPETENIEP